MSLKPLRTLLLKDKFIFIYEDLATPYFLLDELPAGLKDWVTGWLSQQPDECLSSDFPPRAFSEASLLAFIEEQDLTEYLKTE